MTARPTPFRPASIPFASLEWLAERSDERILLAWALAVAVLVHGLAFMIDLPEPAVVVPPPRWDGPVIKNFPLRPPPPTDRSVWTPADTTRRTPIPVRDMDSTGPVAEPPSRVFDDRFFDDEIDLPIAEYEPPPSAGQIGPLVITPDIHKPVLIEDSKVPPEYPEVPRIAGMSGDVILQAVIHRDGTVGEVTVLRANPPGLGFEESAIEAVQQWRYEPARRHDVAVEVYFTVYISFEVR